MRSVRRTTAMNSSKRGNQQPTKCKLSIFIPLIIVGCLGLNLFLVYRHMNSTSDMNKEVSTTDLEGAINMPKENLKTTKIIINNSNENIEHNRFMSDGQSPVVVAHVVSLIKCAKQASVTGFLDAAAVLRHSIHKQSIHTGNSKYSYKMYAIVHEECKNHAKALSQYGYESLVRPTPVQLDEIRPGWYRDHVEGENCCGSKEFIKLYAYTLMQHPIVVHWDMDVAILQPMDDLFDSMLYNADSPEGQAARSRLELQHPERPLPESIDAYLTKDITSSQPWETRQGVQGGFLVARPSNDHFQQILSIIKDANYTAGRGNGKGWGGLGYGGFQGAMAYQGIIAYFYDQFLTNQAVELDVCTWNQVVADVIWRGPTRMEHYKQCREYPRPGDTFETNTPELGKCKDCRITPISQVKTVHYTACKKPWECQIPHPRNPKNKAHVERLQELTNITTCGLLFRKWFDLRKEVEDELKKVGNIAPSARDGAFSIEYFGGYCKRQGQYIPMELPPDDFDIDRIYKS